MMGPAHNDQNNSEEHKSDSKKWEEGPKPGASPSHSGDLNSGFEFSSLFPNTRFEAMEAAREYVEPNPALRPELPAMPSDWLISQFEERAQGEKVDLGQPSAAIDLKTNQFAAAKMENEPLPKEIHLDGLIEKLRMGSKDAWDGFIREVRVNRARIALRHNRSVLEVDGPLKLKELSSLHPQIKRQAEPLKRTFFKLQEITKIQELLEEKGVALFGQEVIAKLCFARCGIPVKAKQDHKVIPPYISEVYGVGASSVVLTVFEDLLAQMKNQPEGSRRMELAEALLNNVRNGDGLIGAVQSTADVSLIKEVRDSLAGMDLILQAASGLRQLVPPDSIVSDPSINRNVSFSNPRKAVKAIKKYVFPL